MNQKTHNRQASNGRKVVQPHSRVSRPGLSTKRVSSYTQIHGHVNQHSQQHTQNRPSSSASRKDCCSEDSWDDSDVGSMAGFLQFCATCEKQIITPGTNILYCSESCRRKDIGFSTPNVTTPPSPIATAVPSYFDHYPTANIIPPRSPTITRPISMLTLSDLTLNDSAFHYHHHDQSTISEPPYRRESEPINYLSQFYADTSAAQLSHARRHRVNRSGADSNIPSLVHSPSSSYGTIASNASYHGLAPRHSNPFANDFSTRKSIDLVIPAASAMTPIKPSGPCSLKSGTSVKSCASTVTSYRVAEADHISHQRSRALMEEQRRADDHLRYMSTR